MTNNPKFPKFFLLFGELGRTLPQILPPSLMWGPTPDLLIWKYPPGIFPLYNIYFLLFLDTVSLFATENTSGLWYRKKIMLFWMLGLLYFHGKRIRFCRAEKFSGTVLEDKESKKYFNPQLSKPRINFAAPSDNIEKLCRKNVRVPCSLKPGVIHSLLDPRWNKTNNQNHLHTLLNFENERERNKWKAQPKQWYLLLGHPYLLLKAVDHQRCGHMFQLMKIRKSLRWNLVIFQK